MHEIVQTPPAQAVHTSGQAPPSGTAVLPQPLDEEVLDDEDEDEALEMLDVLDALEALDDALDEALDAPPVPASLAAGSSCAPMMSAHAGAARPTSASAARTMLL